MAGLSKEQLLVINSILYADGGNGTPNAYEGWKNYPTLGNLAQDFDKSKMDGNKTCGGLIKGETMRKLADNVNGDARLSNLKILAAHTTENGGRSMLLADPSTKEAIVVFSGTGKNEWGDNFKAGATGGMSRDQGAAQKWFNSLDLTGYDSVTVTGHSKGGNKAKLITILGGSDRCVSFDGQGFSDEFMESHKNEIAANQGKIENHNCDNDYVNLLLNDVGETHFYEGHNVSNFAENHVTTSMLNIDGVPMMKEVSRPPAMVELDNFLNSALRNLPPEKKGDFLNALGDILQYSFDSGDLTSILKNVLASGNREAIGYLLTYAVQYEHQTGRLGDALAQLFGPNASGIIGVVDGFLNLPPWARAAIGTYLKRGEIMSWAINDLLRWLGINIDISLLYRLFGLIGDVVLIDAFINVTIPDGADIVMPGPYVDDIDQILNETSSFTLRMHPDEMRQAARKLLGAAQDYEHATQAADRAGAELAACWEGKAQQAFVAHHARSFAWYHSLAQCARRYGEVLYELADCYEAADLRAGRITRGC